MSIYQSAILARVRHRYPNNVAACLFEAGMNHRAIEQNLLAIELFESIEEALQNSEWDGKNWDMIHLIRMAIQYRTDKEFDVASATARISRVLDRRATITGYERQMAWRILEMIEER